MIGTYTTENPPVEIVTADYRFTRESVEFLPCVDCDAGLRFDGEVYRCVAECGGVNTEDGLHPADIMPEWNEIVTMAENGRLALARYDFIALEDEEIEA